MRGWMTHIVDAGITISWARSLLFIYLAIDVLYLFRVFGLIV